ncbi:Metal tolerance protein C1 [Vitis vinifera]|uniref:Metal tolerance protein C1 n=1 Tax=Vitis vinifera TaxID=29760 RepID=A0A438KH30_VITVI|nr:Metal tolerance protein C1 [Vitis vinifera]
MVDVKGSKQGKSYLCKCHEGGSILGVKFLDPLAGLVVSGMILKAGLGTGYQSVMELVDAAVPVQQLDPIKETILQVDGVKGCHRLRGRRAGSSLYLDVHIEVDPFSSVSAAHNVGENVRHQIHKSHPGVSEVFIHIDSFIEGQLIKLKLVKSYLGYACFSLHQKFVAANHPQIGHSSYFSISLSIKLLFCICCICSHPSYAHAILQDPAISQISPSIMEQQENLKEMNYQKRNVSSEHNGHEVYDMIYWKLLIYAMENDPGEVLMLSSPWFVMHNASKEVGPRNLIPVCLKNCKGFLKYPQRNFLEIEGILQELQKLCRICSSIEYPGFV